MLLETYDLLDKADALVAKHQFKDAAKAYALAAAAFKQSVATTGNREVHTALELLVEQCTRRALELGALDNVKSSAASLQQQQQQQQQQHKNKDSILGSLASARGMMSVQRGGESDEAADPVATFQLQVLALLKTPTFTATATATATADHDKPLELKRSGKSVEELELENATLKQLLSQCSEKLQLHESFHKKVRANLKNYLAILKRDLQQQERMRKQDYDNRIETLTRDNSRLEATTRKLTARWNELVESARKRRDDKK